MTAPATATRTIERAATVVNARYVSQHTAFAVFGIAPRRFLEIVRATPELPRTKIGKLILVRADALDARLRELSDSGDARDDASETVAAKEPETAADVLALLGRRSVRG